MRGVPRARRAISDTASSWISMLRIRADLDRDPELVGDDVRQSRLAEARRPAQQHVLNRLITPPRGLEKDAEVFPHLLLPHILAEVARPQREVELLVVRLRIQNLLFRHLRPRAFNANASASWVEGDVFQSTDSMPVRASWDEKPRLRSAGSTAFGTAPSPATAAARATASRAPTAPTRGR